jgi:hypothetical protein
MKTIPSDPFEFERWLATHNERSEEHFDSLHLAIGKLTVSFASLEWELNQAFALAVNDSNLEIGLSIADRLTYSQTIELFEATASLIVSEEGHADLKPLIERLRVAGRLRNDVAHSSFGYVLGGEGEFLKTPSRIKGKNKERGSPMVEPLGDIDSATESIDKTTEMLHHFITEYI